MFPPGLDPPPGLPDLPPGLKDLRLEFSAPPGLELSPNLSSPPGLTIPSSKTPKKRASKKKRTRKQLDTEDYKCLKRLHDRLIPHYGEIDWRDMTKNAKPAWQPTPKQFYLNDLDGFPPLS